jgi:addiction module HigA family antidote
MPEGGERGAEGCEGVTTRRNHARYRWTPDYAVLPGETIREAFQERGWTQVQAAAFMGIHQSELSHVINGHRAVSALTALRLEAVTGVSASLWAGLQAQYDIAVVRQSRDWAAESERIAARKGTR